MFSDQTLPSHNSIQIRCELRPAIMFAEKILQPFPLLKPGQRIQRTAHRGDVTFDVPKLWHTRIAVENGGKSSAKSDATVSIKRKKV